LDTARVATFVPYSRDQTFLLPPDLAHFVVLERPAIRPDTWRNHEVRRVTQAAPIRRSSMLRRPHHPFARASRPQRKQITSASAGSIAFQMDSEERGVSLPEKFVGQLLPTAVTDAEKPQAQAR
jgi:hypothetical protein